jgi:hypothetical protein
MSLFIMRLCGSMLPHNRTINNDVISFSEIKSTYIRMHGATIKIVKFNLGPVVMPRDPGMWKKEILQSDVIFMKAGLYFIFRSLSSFDMMYYYI